MIKLEFKVLFSFLILLISFSLSFALPLEKDKVVNIQQTSYDYIEKQIIEIERDRVIGEEKYAKSAMEHLNAWFVDTTTLIADKKILQDCRSRYMEIILPDQMAANGSFPLELKRTKPYSYSLFNLDATASLAWILSDKSFDVWNYSLPDGRGIKKGLDFILPYLKDKTTWTFGKDVFHWEVQPGARQFMLYAAVAQNNPEWFKLWKSLDEKDRSDESRLALPLKNPLLWIGLD